MNKTGRIAIIKIKRKYALAYGIGIIGAFVKIMTGKYLSKDEQDALRIGLSKTEIPGEWAEMAANEMKRLESMGITEERLREMSDSEYEEFIEKNGGII